METIASSTHEDSMEANPSSVKSEDSSPCREDGRGSPPPNCAICLGTCRNKSFTDSCLHQFCFTCLLTWSKVKAECPLCKQNFRSIIHNVRSNHQYDEYTVEQRHEETTQSIDIDTLANATRRFRYRTTLTLARRETLAIQQLLLHYPLTADVFPPPPRAPPARRRREPAAFRRTVYRHNLWARPLPDFTGRFRDCTPSFYRYNDSQMHRLVPWINRELHYLLNDNVGHISYVTARILELLPQYHINSPEFREALQRYFGDRTEHFLHELYCFASTPYDMTGYDRNVQYTTDSRISTMVNEVISSSESEASVDSDIVMVSHSEPAEPPPGPSRLPAPAYPQNYIPQPPPADNVIPIETISHSDTDDDSSEVVVVGYIKPPQDRTPEVVDLLGSDSDVIVQENGGQAEAAGGEAGEVGAAPLVKLSLKRPRASPPPAARRRRRAFTATTSDTSRSTPSPAAAEPPSQPPRRPSPHSTTSAYSPTTSSSTPSSSSLSITDSEELTSSSSSACRKRRLTKKKSKRKTRKGSPVKRKRARRDRRSSPRAESQDRRSKRKSHSGKGVKSSKRSAEPASAAPEPERTPPLPDERAGPSDASRARPTCDRNRRRSHESRRLKSVVNIMYKNSGDSNSGCSSVGNAPSSSTLNQNGYVASEQPAPETKASEMTKMKPNTPTLRSVCTQKTATCMDDDDTDSEDNLPLNLTVQKTLNPPL